MSSLTVEQDTGMTRLSDGDTQTLPWSGGLGWHYAWQAGMSPATNPAIAAPAGIDPDWREKMELARRIATANRHQPVDHSASFIQDEVGAN